MKGLKKNSESYQVLLTDTAIKSLKSVPTDEKRIIFRKIEELGDNPLKKSVKKLVDFDISYSMRVGNYRVLFERDDYINVINIIDIRHRKESYRRK